ncbi:MAG TPA: alpha/beta hydrolase [Steroidobacteraceae bacterium]|nr:alpha/beta hydrolase [Steroidobacteraceae bacterium]
MRRREFVEISFGAAAMGSLGACVSPLVPETTNGATSPLDARAFQAARKFAALSFGRIAYVERGRGEAALFLHGFPLNGFQWRGAIERLSTDRRCIAPDFLGLGFTEVAKGQSVAPSAQVEMLAALLDHFQLQSVDVVANDSGGAVAQLFALRYPQRVRTMLLTNCDVEPDSPPPSLMPVIELARAGRFANEWLAPWIADKALARSANGLGGLCYSKPGYPSDEAIDCYLRPLISSPQRNALTNAYAAALDPNPLAGIEAKLKGCRIPTRIVWGTGDTIFSSASPDYLDRLLPNSRGVRRVPGAKLFFPEEYPEVIAEEAKRLWQRT